MRALAMQPLHWYVRLGAWLRLAYTEPSSRERRVLMETIISLVIVSVVVTVLERDSQLAATYQSFFQATEAIVLAAFVIDFGLHLAYAPSRRAYLLSFWGLVDLLAIVPGLLLFVNLSELKALRGLRFIRFLRILKVTPELERRGQLPEGEGEASVFIDLQLALIGIASLLLFVSDDGLRTLLLAFALVATYSIGLRRWLVWRQHHVLSVAVLLASILAAAVAAVQLDAGGHAVRAVGLVILTVAVALISWLRIEAPAGAL